MYSKWHNVDNINILFEENKNYIKSLKWDKLIVS